MHYEITHCILCKTYDFSPLFQKQSDAGEIFTLVRCNRCGLEFVNPRPPYEEMWRYYTHYFTNRTDRGYDNYFSSTQQAEVLRILQLNLEDLNFFDFESSLGEVKNHLDIGCAAGYCVKYFSDRGWNSEGIDISQECINYARTILHVNAYCGDFLSHQFTKHYQCITLWATIEHLHYPDAFLKKIHHLLDSNGILLLSTCRSSAFSPRSIFGKNWRFYNFPHHLYFFSYKTIRKLLHLCGFTITRFSTYGSGIGKPFSIARKCADFVAKHLYLGDMMLVAARKY